jgi:phosphoglycolate phosphatase
MLMIKLCVFDCDGTLIDSQHSIVECMATAFVAHGLAEPTAASVRHVVGLALTPAVAQLVPDAGEEAHERIAQSYRDAFTQLRRSGGVREPLYPGVLEGLAAIEAAGWLLGIATGKSRRGLIATLTGHGLHGRFVTLQTADSAPSKPAPDMILRAMGEAGAEPRATVMVGDTTYDMQMARNAGASAVGVAWGYHDEQHLWDSGAHAVIGDFADLAGVVERVTGPARSP